MEKTPNQKFLKPVDYIFVGLAAIALGLIAGVAYLALWGAILKSLLN